MNEDELKAFEEELAQLKPRAPSARLRARLDVMVDQHSGDRPRERPSKPATMLYIPLWRWRRAAPWLTAAAGLALAAGVLWWRPFDPGRELELDDTRPPAEVAAAPVEDASADTRASDSPFRPVKARNSLRNRIDEGLVTLDNGLSARQYRFQFVDTVVWENPKDGSQFEVSTPREEILLVPVHTF